MRDYKPGPNQELKTSDELPGFTSPPVPRMRMTVRDREIFKEWVRQRYANSSDVLEGSSDDWKQTCGAQSSTRQKVQGVPDADQRIEKAEGCGRPH